MGKLETFGIIVIITTLLLAPIFILGDNLSFLSSDESNNEATTNSGTPAPLNKDVNMAQEMQKAIDTLEINGVDTTELRNLKTEYAAYNGEEELAMLEDDFENVIKYRNEKEKIILSFAEILKENGYHSLNIYEYLNHNGIK